MQTIYKQNFASKFARAFLLSLVVAFASFSNANAQVVVTGDGAGGSPYSDLQSAIAAVNGVGTLTQPTTITLQTGNPQTAPAGGYVITATGSAANTLVITGAGSGSIVTAYTPQATGSINDAIFKIVGGDYITITGFQMQENSGNAVLGVATNQMTEFGVAIYAGASGTDGAKNNTVSNNNISLNSLYTQAIGVMSTSVFTSANGTTATATTTPATGGENSNNTINGNTISNVAFGIYVLSANATATFSETGWIIGQSGNGNIITYTGNANFTTAYHATYHAAALAVHGGIMIRNAIGSNVSYNTISSGSSITSVSTNGVVFSASTAPTGVTYTNTASNNTVSITVTNATASNTTNGIDFGYGLTATGTIISNSNNVTINQNTTVAATGAIVGIKAAYASLNNTCNGNTVTINQTHSLSSATAISNSSTVTGITAAAAATGDISASNNIININQTVNNTFGALATLSGAVIGVTAATTAVNNSVNNNKVTIVQQGSLSGSTASTGATLSGSIIGVTNNAASSTIGNSYTANYNKVLITQKSVNTATGATGCTVTVGGSATTGISLGGITSTLGSVSVLGDSVSIVRNVSHSASTQTFSVGTGQIVGIQVAQSAQNITVGSASISADQNIVIRSDDSASIGTTTYGAGINYFIQCNVISSTNVIVSGNKVGTGSSFSTINDAYLRGTSTAYGIYHYITTSGTYDVSGNTIYMNRSRAAANTATTYGMYTFASSAATVTSYNVNNNTINLYVNSSTSGTTIGMNQTDGTSAGGPTNKVIRNNTITIGGNGFTVQGMLVGYYGTTNVGASGYPNTINISSGNTGAIGLTGILGYSTAVNLNIAYNNIQSIVASAAGTTAQTLIGIKGSTSSTVSQNINNNTITGLSTGATTGSSLASGIEITTGTLSNVYKNNIYNLSVSSTGTSSMIRGLNITGGTVVNIYNNLISQQNALTGVTGVTPTTATAGDNVRGINLTGATASTSVNVYNNTIYLNTSSTGANFGATGIFHTTSATATTSALDLRNNIIINLTPVRGTGISSVLKRSSTTLTNYSTNSNNNLLYVILPSAAYPIFYDGTNKDTTLADFKTRMATRDGASLTGEAAFDYAATSGVSQFFTTLTPTVTDFLKPLNGISTQVEAGGTVISTSGNPVATVTITDDYNNATGNRSTTPDIGAYEFTATSPAPSNILATPSNQCTNGASTTVSATVTTPSGTIDSVRITYNNGGGNTTALMTNTSGNTWSYDIPAGTAGATVTWSITSYNSLLLTTTTTGTGFVYLPLTGVTALATANPASICNGSSSSLTAALSKSGSATLGTTGVLVSGTSSTNFSAGQNFFGNYWGNARQQWLIRANEMTAAGFGPGTITSIGIPVTSVGSPNPILNFTLKMATTSATTITSAFLAPTFTTVYTNASYTITANTTNTITFSTPFYWDGVSNIVIENCFSNQITGSTGAADNYVTPGFACYAGYGADGTGGAGACTATATSTSGAARPQFIFAGNLAPAITSVDWQLSGSSVGTTNPLSVSPSNSTLGAAAIEYIYTPTITASGCVYNATVPTATVTVNSTPIDPQVDGTAPTQCGIPRYTVTSAASSPIYNFYTASTGGTLLATNSTGIYDYSGYTPNATNTVWVSVTDAGCTSNRVQIDVFANAPTSLTATSNTATCQNRVETLTITTPLSNFNSYLWSPITHLYTDAACTTKISSSTSYTTVYFLSPTAGTETITVNATDVGASECSNTASIVMTINANPTVANVTATPATVCSGGNVSLVAETTIITNGTVSIGSGATTTSTYNAPFYSLWSNKKMQYLIKASELTAASLYAGNITGISFPTTSGTVSNKDYSIKIAHTTASDLASAFATGTFTTVYSVADQPQTANTDNTLTFSAPFNWNGTSDIVVEICWGDNTTTATLSSTSPADNTSYVSVRGQYNTSATSGTNVCSGGTTTVSYSVRPKIKFVGQTVGYGAGTLAWSWSSTSGGGITSTYPSSNTGTAVPTNTGSSGTITYSVVGSLAAAPYCATTVAATAVTVNPLPVALTDSNATTGSGAGTINQCGTPTFLVNASSVASPTYKFYAHGTNTVLQSGSSLSYTHTGLYTTPIDQVDVTVTDGNGCESDRTVLSINVTDPPTLTVSQSGNVQTCVNKIETIAITSNTSNFTSYVWSPATNLYANSNGTGALTGNETTVYYKRSSATASEAITLNATVGSCSASSVVTFAVGANPIVTTVTASPTSVCSGANVTLGGTSISAVTNTATVGTATTTVSTTGNPYRAGAGTASQIKTQVLLLASQLTAAGLTAGPITKLGFNVTSTSGTFINFDIKMAATASTSLTTTFVASGLTTVFHADSYTPTVGANMHTLTSAFNWDGSSNIILDFCQTNSVLGTNVMSAVTATGQNVYTSGTTGCTATTGTATTTKPVVLIEGQVGTDVASTYVWSWSDGIGGTISNGLPTTANPSVGSTSTVTYTATATVASTGCFTTGTSNSITVNALPSAPTATSLGSQCGQPTFAIAAVSGMTYKWYAAASGGTAISGATGTSYTPTTFTGGGAVNSYWATVTNAGGCESPRTQVDVAVSDAPSIAAQSSASTICGGVIATLSVTAGTVGNFDTYLWSPSTNLYTDASATTPYTGENISTVYYKRSSATTGDTISVTGIYNGGALPCSNFATVIMVVNANPNITSIIATPSSVCSGSTVSLSAATTGITTGTTYVGAGATTTSTYNAPFYSAWSNKKVQYLFTAAELASFNLSAGSITSIGFPTTSGTVSNKDYSIKIAHTTATDLSSAFATGTFTTVYTATQQAQTANTDNVITLASPFTWDGTSSIVVELCWGDNTTTATLSSTSPADNTSYVSSRVQYTTSATSGTVACAGGTTTTTYSQRPKILFGGQISGDNSGSFLWGWKKGATTVGTPNPVTSNNPTNSTFAVDSVIYTARATDPVTNCYTDASATAVAVNPIPVIATTNDGTTVCGVPTFTATSAYSGVTYNWYAASTGGTALQSSTNANYIYNAYASSPGGTVNTLYVDVTVGGCTSASRTAVNITSTTPPALVLSQVGSVNTCVDRIETVTASGTGYTSYTWSPFTNLYSDASATVAYAGENLATVYYKRSSVTSSPASYVCLATGGGCENTNAVSFTVNSNPPMTTAVASPTPVCEGATVNLTATSIDAQAGSTTIGTETTTISGSDGNPLRSGNGTGNQIRMQLLLRASQLTAAGLTTGNITALAFNMPGTQSGTVANFEIKLATTTSTTLTTSFLPTGSMTSVYTTATYTPTTGLNVFTFSTPFFWDGTSNIVINTCQTNSVLGTTIISAYTPSFASQCYKASATTSCTDVTGTAMATAPVVTLYGQVGTNITSSLAWSWSYGASGVGTSSASTTTPAPSASSATYSVTAVNTTTTCYNSRTTNTITINSLPSAPVSTTAVSQCGTPTYSVATVSGMTYKWYTVATGGTAISGATSTSYTYLGYTGGATNTLYVTATNSNGCESPRTQIDVAVSNPPVLTVSANSNTTCQSRIQTLSVSSTLSDFNVYTWSPITNLYVDAGATTAYTGGNATTLYYKNSSVTASDVITVTGTNTSAPYCVNTATVTMTVQANPVASISVSPSTTSVCSGNTVTLNGVVAGSQAGTATIGTNGTTLGTTTTQMGLTPFSGYYGSQHTQYLITASSLTAKGLVAGNLTALALDVTAVNSTQAYTGYTVKVGHSTATGLTAAVSTPLTTVYTSDYTPSVGLNVFTFGTGGTSSSFAWDGTSNLIVDVCFYNTSFSNNDVVKATATSPSYTCTYGYYRDGASLCDVTYTTTTSSTSLPDITFYGQKYLNIASNYTWSWTSNLGGSIANGASTSDVPSTTTGASLVYTATVLNASTSCSTVVNTTAKTLYAAGITPSITISTATSTVCSGNSVLFTSSATTGSTTPSYQWKKNGTSIPGATGTTYTAPANTLISGDAITCELTTNNPCSTPPVVSSNSITLSVLPSPTVNPITDAYSAITTSKVYCNYGLQSGYAFYVSTPGGTWSSTDASVFTTVAATTAQSTTNPYAVYINTKANGTAQLKYSVPATNGCVTNAAVTIVVNKQSAPSAISGPSAVCKGSSISLSSATSGGVWSSDAYGSINSSGVYTGVNTASASVVKYTTTNADGCSASTSYSVTVRALPAIPSVSYASGTVNPQVGAGGGTNICRGKTFTLVGSPSGGTWTSVNATYMTVNAAGVVNTVANGGPAGITYTYTNAFGCASSRTIGGWTVVTCASKGTSSSVLKDKDVLVSSLYPNPATNIVNIRLEMLVGKADMVMTDVLGKQVRSQSLSLGNNEIDVTGLSKGMYLVSITTGTGKQVQKLVVE